MNRDHIYSADDEDASLMANGRHSYVRFFPSDWLAGTARLPRLHRSAMFDLCCYIWDANKPVPEREAGLMLADLKDWRAIIDDLISMGKLVRNDDGSLSNARALAEAEKSHGLWKAKSDGGKLARSAGKSDAKSDVRTDPTEPEPEPEPDLEPSGSNPYAGEAWDGWIESRKKAPTERAVRLAISTLTKLKAEGHDPIAVLDQSTLNGWTGLFPLKGHTNGTGNLNGSGHVSGSPYVKAAIDRKAERAAGGK